MNGVKEFKEKLKNDKGFREKFKNIKNEQDAVKLAKRLGFEINEEEILKDFVQMNAQQKKDAAASFAAYAAEHVSTDKNMRASKEYRSLLVKVLTRRAWEEIGGRAE